MDFNYSENQGMLADSLRRLMQAEYGFEQRRRIQGAQEGVHRATWLQLAEVGVLGLLIDADSGGFGEGAESLLTVQRELGRSLMREPVIPSAVIATSMLQASGSVAQKASWLSAMARGDFIATPAYLEPHSRFDAAAVRTRAIREKDGYLMEGRKSLVWHAGDSDGLIVSACMDTAPGLTLFLLPTSTPGVKLTSYPTMDGHRAADVELAGVRLPADAVLGSPGHGLQTLQHGLDWGIAALCAEGAGAMEKVIEDTADYLRTRRQFGVPLGSFQALQHRMADMLVQKELALSMAFVAVQALSEEDEALRARMLAAAKYNVAKAARFVGEQAIQLHGGMGMTRELPLGDYFKRLTMLDPLLGDADAQLARFSAAMT